MSLAHLTLPTPRVEPTAALLQRIFGFARDPLPANVVGDTVWLNIGNRQQLHVLFVDGFEVSPFEAEFGRHIALYHDAADFAALQQRVRDQGAELIAPLRATRFRRFFFREPINGYVFEVIER